MTDHNTESDPAQEQDPIWMPARDAAKIYNVEPRSIRKRITAGTIAGRMVSGMWWVGVPRADAENAGLNVSELIDQFAEEDPESSLPEGSLVLRTEATKAGPVDLGPLADLVADLTRKNIEMAAEAARYHERALQLEERLNSTTMALEAGKVASTETEQRLQQEKDAAIEEARRAMDQEWRSKTWWARLTKGE